MMIEVSTSGGLAGMARAAPAKRLDLATVEAAVQDRYCDHFDPAALRALSAAAPDRHGADRFSYHITVTDEAGARHEFDLSEDQLPPEMLDLIDEM